jgi:hypothetical protein
MVQRQAMQKPIWCSVLPWLCQHANLLTQTNLVKATSKPDITNLIPSSHNHSSCTLMTVYTVLGFSAIAVLNSVANNLSTVKRTWDWNNIFEIGWDNRVLGYYSHQVVSYAFKTILCNCILIQHDLHTWPPQPLKLLSTWYSSIDSDRSNICHGITLITPQQSIALWGGNCFLRQFHHHGLQFAVYCIPRSKYLSVAISSNEDIYMIYASQNLCMFLSSCTK